MSSSFNRGKRFAYQKHPLRRTSPKSYSFDVLFFGFCFLIFCESLNKASLLVVHSLPFTATFFSSKQPSGVFTSIISSNRLQAREKNKAFMCEGAFSPIAPSIPQVSATDDEIASSAIPPTALSPYYPFSSTSNIRVGHKGQSSNQCQERQRLREQLAF